MSSARLEHSGEGAGAYRLSGRLDFDSVVALWRSASTLFGRAGDGNGPPTRIDLAGVEQSNSAGVALLVEWQRMAQSKGGELTFINVPEQMVAIIEVADLQNVLRIG